MSKPRKRFKSEVSDGRPYMETGLSTDINRLADDNKNSSDDKKKEISGLWPLFILLGLLLLVLLLGWLRKPI